MEITVIVPVYNVEAYLGKCIDSVLGQTFSDFELILVNDGSTDNSGVIAREYADKYPDKIKLIEQENAGLSAARNTGLKASRGKYIAFVDSDDSIEPDMLNKMHSIAKEKKSDLVICAFRSVDENGNEIKKFFEPMLDSSKAYSLKSKKELLFCQNAVWNKLYKKQIIDENSLEFTEGVWYEDVRFVKKYLLHSENVVYCENVFYNYLIRQGSIMNSMSDKRNLQIIGAFDEVIDYYKKNKIFEEYREEIEFCAIEHVFIAALVRLIRAGRLDMVKSVRKAFEERFPNFSDNKYIRALSLNQKIVYHLNKMKLYFIVKLIFSVKG